MQQATKLDFMKVRFILTLHTHKANISYVLRAYFIDENDNSSKIVTHCINEAIMQGQ